MHLDMLLGSCRHPRCLRTCSTSPVERGKLRYLRIIIRLKEALVVRIEDIFILIDSNIAAFK